MTSAVSSPIIAKAKRAFTWPSSIVSNPIPYRYRRRVRSKLRSRQSPASSLTSIETSCNPIDTYRALRAHKWSVYDAQYIVLVTLIAWSLFISHAPSVLLKSCAVFLMLTALAIPVTRQFFLPFLPIGTWLVFFFSARFIPSEYRPHIWVRVLPALENVLYGANLSNILSAHQHVVLDVLAWLPYGIIHFAAPFLCSAAIFIFCAPGTLPVFARSFGYMNIIGVTLQIVFPCSPPWYENMYGLAPANYSMDGSPAGLARIDALFGLDMYTTNFTASPMVFGAFPSLHSGTAVIEALFLSYLFPRIRPLLFVYVMWLWWATMYLSHHYAVDLVGGALISATVFYIARTNFLPRPQPENMTRWDYDYVEIGDKTDESPDGRGAYSYGMHEYKARPNLDAWSIGSSSSVSSESSRRESVESHWEEETLADEGEMYDGVVR